MKAIELIFFALYSSCLIWIMKFFPFLTDFNFSPVFRDLMLTWVKNGAQDISTTLCSIWLIFLHKILITLLNKMSHGIRDILIFHWNIKKIIFRNKIPSSTESKNSITFFFSNFLTYSMAYFAHKGEINLVSKNQPNRSNRSWDILSPVL